MGEAINEHAARETALTNTQRNETKRNETKILHRRDKSQTAHKERSISRAAHCHCQQASRHTCTRRHSRRSAPQHQTKRRPTPRARQPPTADNETEHSARTPNTEHRTAARAVDTPHEETKKRNDHTSGATSEKRMNPKCRKHSGVVDRVQEKHIMETGTAPQPNPKPRQGTPVAESHYRPSTLRTMVDQGGTRSPTNATHEQRHMMGHNAPTQPRRMKNAHKQSPRTTPTLAAAAAAAAAAVW